MHILFKTSINQVKDRNWPFSEFAIYVVRFLGPLYLETHNRNSSLLPFQNGGKIVE